MRRRFLPFETTPLREAPMPSLSKLLRNIANRFGRGSAPEPSASMHQPAGLRGYVYWTEEEGGLFLGAKVGDTIVKPNQDPPWIVVDHHIRDVLVTRWPGKLYGVEVLDASGETHLMSGVKESATYTRTCGVRILEELPLARLFGGNGQELCRILDFARGLSEEQVHRLSRCDLEPSEKVYDHAWRKWSSLRGAEILPEPGAYRDLLKTVCSIGEHGSPIGNGLCVVHSLFFQRAQELAGDSAFSIDDDDGDEDAGISFLPEWDRACQALVHAAMSCESENLLTASEKALLRKPVAKVFGVG